MNREDKNVNLPIKRVQVREKMKMEYRGDLELLLFFAQ